MSELDAAQNVQIAANTTAISKLETSVAVIGTQIAGQNEVLEKISAGTSQFGSDMRDQMREMREAQALERKEERDAAATDRAAERGDNAKWWAQAWKVAAGLVSALTLAAGGAGYAAYQPPAAVPAHAAPAAISAPAVVDAP